MSGPVSGHFKTACGSGSLEPTASWLSVHYATQMSWEDLPRAVIFRQLLRRSDQARTRLRPDECFLSVSPARAGYSFTRRMIESGVNTVRGRTQKASASTRPEAFSGADGATRARSTMSVRIFHLEAADWDAPSAGIKIVERISRT